MLSQLTSPAHVPHWNSSNLTATHLSHALGAVDALEHGDFAPSCVSRHIPRQLHCASARVLHGPRPGLDNTPRQNVIFCPGAAARPYATPSNALPRFETPACTVPLYLYTQPWAFHCRHLAGPSAPMPSIITSPSHHVISSTTTSALCAIIVPTRTHTGVSRSRSQSGRRIGRLGDALLNIMESPRISHQHLQRLGNIHHCEVASRKLVILGTTDAADALNKFLGLASKLKGNGRQSLRPHAPVPTIPVDARACEISAASHGFE